MKPNKPLKGLIPGDVIVVDNTQQMPPSLWTETHGSDIVMERLPRRLPMLVICSDDNYAFVLICQSVGYVSLHQVSKAFE